MNEYPVHLRMNDLAYCLAKTQEYRSNAQAVNDRALKTALEAVANELTDRAGASLRSRTRGGNAV
jgi:hypothetical protein